MHVPAMNVFETDQLAKFRGQAFREDFLGRGDKRR